MADFAGKYALASRENFDSFLKALDLPMVTRTVAAALDRSLAIDVNGNEFVITITTRAKSVESAFTPGASYESDLLVLDRPKKYLADLQDNVLTCREIDDPASKVSMFFDGEMLVMEMTTKGVTARHCYKRQ